MEINISSYLKRIKFKLKPKVDLDTLSLLQKAHLLHIPFENLDIHYNTEIRLDINRIFTKVITNGRGGFCYELNGLFYQLLLTLGFEAKLITCRVYKEATGYGKEHAHMAVLVKLGEDEYLSDVGFGAFAMGPLALSLGLIQHDLKGNFQIDQYDETHLQVSKWVAPLDGISNEDTIASPEYIFRKDKMNYTDFEEMCHYTQTSPDSHFTQKIIITRPTLTGRISLTGDTLKITEGSAVKSKKVKNKTDFDDLLCKYFYIRM